MKIQSKRYRKTHCISWIIVSIHLQRTWIKNIIFGVFGIFATVWAQLWAMCVLDAFTNEIASQKMNRNYPNLIFSFCNRCNLSGTNAVWNEVYCFILPSEYWESWPKFQRFPFEVTLLFLSRDVRDARHLKVVCHDVTCYWITRFIVCN